MTRRHPPTSHPELNIPLVSVWRWANPARPPRAARHRAMLSRRPHTLRTHQSAEARRAKMERYAKKSEPAQRPLSSSSLMARWRICVRPSDPFYDISRYGSSSKVSVVKIEKIGRLYRCGVTPAHLQSIADLEPRTVSRERMRPLPGTQGWKPVVRMCMLAWRGLHRKGEGWVGTEFAPQSSASR